MNEFTRYLTLEKQRIEGRLKSTGLELQESFYLNSARRHTKKARHFSRRNPMKRAGHMDAANEFTKKAAKVQEEMAALKAQLDPLEKEAIVMRAKFL